MKNSPKSKFVAAGMILFYDASAIIRSNNG